jgi:hypothetical protein
MRRLACLVVLTALSATPGCAAPDPILVRQADPDARTVQPVAPPRDSLPSDAIEERLLTAHNAERARVGSPALIWDDGLEREARVWAQHLLDTARFEHDPARHGHGENLWTGWGERRWTPEEMVGEWIVEKVQYRDGVFPAVSRTGDWTAVGHYTQLVWSGTTHVGCAIASRGDRSVLACRYNPPGNIDGMRAY